jgi:O-6-methylguanine DNA methyltransferase
MPGEFFKMVHALVMAIPPGRVMTYGSIAAFLGKPGASRIVVYALRKTPSGVEIPWHRVVGAGGRIPPRRSFEDADDHLLQESMLRSEGVPFTAGGKVDLDQCLWKPGEDPLLP